MPFIVSFYVRFPPDRNSTPVLVIFTILFSLLIILSYLIFGNKLDKYMTEDDSKKELEKKWKKTEQEEMKEEAHQLDLKKGYEKDEAYEESEE